MCGLAHSTLVSVPVILTGLVSSNSAANEWWACSRGPIASARDAAQMAARAKDLVIREPPENASTIQRAQASWKLASEVVVLPPIDELPARGIALGVPGHHGRRLARRRLAERKTMRVYVIRYRRDRSRLDTRTMV